MIDKIFYVLGLLAVVVGIAWTALTLSRSGGLGGIVVALPGVSLAGSGLLMLAIASALDYLRRIARNTADTADAVEAIARATAKSE